MFGTKQKIWQAIKKILIDIFYIKMVCSKAELRHLDFNDSLSAWQSYTYNN